MTIDYVSPFVVASRSVLQTLLSTELMSGCVSTTTKFITSRQVNVICGVTGDFEGQIVYGMNQCMADRLASAFIGANMTTANPLAASTIAELGNMITGQAITLLSQQGYTCKISPPTLVDGSSNQFTIIGHSAQIIPIGVEGFGLLEISIGLHEQPKEAA